MGKKTVKSKKTAKVKKPSKPKAKPAPKKSKVVVKPKKASPPKVKTAPPAKKKSPPKPKAPAKPSPKPAAKPASAPKPVAVPAPVPFIRATPPPAPAPVPYVAPTPVFTPEPKVEPTQPASPIVSMPEPVKPVSQPIHQSAPVPPITSTLQVDNEETATEDEYFEIVPSKEPVVMTPFLLAQKQKLEDLKDHLLDQMQDVAQGNLRTASEAGSAFGQHMGDAGSDAYEKDFALSLLSQEQDALYEIEEALKRIDFGTYGRCEKSGKDIPLERLDAIPWARYTVTCQAELERSTRGRNRWDSSPQFMDSVEGADEEDEDSEEEGSAKAKE